MDEKMIQNSIKIILVLMYMYFLQANHALTPQQLQSTVEQAVTANQDGQNAWHVMKATMQLQTQQKVVQCVNLENIAQTKLMLPFPVGQVNTGKVVYYCC